MSRPNIRSPSTPRSCPEPVLDEGLCKPMVTVRHDSYCAPSVAALITYTLTELLASFISIAIIPSNDSGCQLAQTIITDSLI
ncbi:hypothetical protein L195_g025530 [Trifolium pratense]|uniref:Uncharacterized protein n=1 Tax=Trifolium pratense TaxID=57577 RepID=A0A2K3NGQ2_TRIPR|nr:hypothetical protein L195_g025530 [Trifolium pratense]